MTVSMDDSKSPSRLGRLFAARGMGQVVTAAFGLVILGLALTAPAYMVTGEFFTILAVKLEVTPSALGWIKIVAETMVPLFVGPFFGWLADRIGADADLVVVGNPTNPTGVLHPASEIAKLVRPGRIVVVDEALSIIHISEPTRPY